MVYAFLVTFATKQYVEELALHCALQLYCITRKSLGMTTGLTLSALTVYALRTHSSKCRSRQRPLCSIIRGSRRYSGSQSVQVAHVTPTLNNSAPRRRSSVTSRVLRLCRIVLALLPTRHDNGIGAQRPISRQCPFRRCIHRRCTSAAFPDSPCSRFTAAAEPIPLLFLSPLPSPFPWLTQLLDELDLSIERPSISIGTFSTSMTDACSPARDEQRA